MNYNIIMKMLRFYFGYVKIYILWIIECNIVIFLKKKKKFMEKKLILYQIYLYIYIIYIYIYLLCIIRIKLRYKDN